MIKSHQCTLAVLFIHIPAVCALCLKWSQPSWTAIYIVIKIFIFYLQWVGNSSSYLNNDDKMQLPDSQNVKKKCRIQWQMLQNSLFAMKH